MHGVEAPAALRRRPLGPKLGRGKHRLADTARAQVCFPAPRLPLLHRCDPVRTDSGQNWDVRTAGMGYKPAPESPRRGAIQPRERGQPRESTPPSPGCPPSNAPRSSAMPVRFLNAKLNNTKKGQTGLETGRSAGGLVQNVRKPSHETCDMNLERSYYGDQRASALSPYKQPPQLER